MLCFISVNSYAQLQISEEFKTILETSISRNVELKNRHLDLEKSSLFEKEIRSNYLPKIEANALVTHFNSDNDFNTKGSIFRGNIVARSVLFSGLQIPHAIKANKFKMEGDQWMLKSEEEKVIFEVLQSFDQYTLLQETQRLIEASEARLALENQKLNTAIANGLAIPNDREKLELAQLELELKKIEIKSNIDLLTDKIAYLTGLNTKEIENTQNELAAINPLQNDFENTEARQELKALEAYRNAQEHLVKKERGSYLPKVAAFAGMNYTNVHEVDITTPVLPIVDNPWYFGLNEVTLGPTFYVGVGLNWQLFSGFERKHKIEQTKVELLKIENKLNDTKEQISLQQQSKENDYLLKQQQLKIAEQKHKIAQSNFETSTKLFQQGLIDIVERIEAENQLIEAAFQETNAAYNLKIALYERYMANGNLASIL